LKKIEEKKKDLEEQAIKERFDIERKKLTLEYEARERKVKELE
jgi:hypothetical protein